MRKIYKTFISVLLAAFVIISFLPAVSVTASAASVDNWDGTADISWYDAEKKSFTIDTAEKLAGLAQIINTGDSEKSIAPDDFKGKTVILTVDINLSDHEWTPMGWYDDENNKVYSFNGEFDGGGHKITGLTINTSTIKGAGLFGVIWSSSRIKDIKAENISITSSYFKKGIAYADVGGIAGRSRGGIIEDCRAAGSLTASGDQACVGGIVGLSENVPAQETDSDGTYIANSNTSGFINGGTLALAGGVSGNNFNRVSNSSSSCTVIGGDASSVGGLIGYNASGEIDKCYSAGNVKGGNSILPYSYVGGFAGYNSGKISNCCAAGNVTGGNSSPTFASYTGGFVGYGKNSISNSFALGEVTGGASEGRKALVGGFMGKSYGDIVNCYAVGNVTGGASATLGGFTGGNGGTLINTYWNKSAVQRVDSTDQLLFNGEDAAAADVNGLTENIMKGAAPDSGITYYKTGSTTDEATGPGAFLTALMGGTEAVQTGITCLGWASDSNNVNIQVNKGYPFLINDITQINVSGVNGATTVEKGKTLNMTAVYLPQNAMDLIKWSITSGNEFASIDAETGVLTATSQGSVTVRATSVYTSPAVYGQATITVTTASTPPVSGGGGGTSKTTPIMTTVETKDGMVTAATQATTCYGTDGIILASVTDSQISDAATKATDKAKNQALNKIEVRIDIKGNNATGYSLNMSDRARDAIKTNGISLLTISTPTVSITFDDRAISYISEKGTGNINILARQINSSNLPQSIRDKVGNRPIYDFTVTSGGIPISDFGGGTAKVSIPYTLSGDEEPNKIVIYYISDSGELTIVPNCTFDSATGRATFKTTHFSKYAVAYNDVNFLDVKSGAWHEDYINFLSARGIVNGTENDVFSPDSNITRAQFVTILANLSGDNLSSYKTISFSDVLNSAWYAAAVEWAYQNGIITGSNGKFNPGQYITRQDMAVMIVRYSEKVAKHPITSTNSSITFTDNAYSFVCL